MKIATCPRCMLAIARNTISSRSFHSRIVSKRKSLYDVLDVPHSATQAEIKAAYYELSLKYHPDVNKTQASQEVFRELTEAYGILSNLNTRREYDKEIGAYFMLRSTRKKEAGEKMLRLTDEMLEIDLRGIKESGVFLSTIATLSTVLQTPVRLTNACVSNGGIQSHDMRVLQLLRKISNGTLAANTGLSTVTYIPGEPLGGNFFAEAGRLGQLSLLVAAVLPCLPFAPIPEHTHCNRVFLKGGTHRYKKMHSDYIQTVVQPFIQKFGFEFHYDIRKRYAFMVHFNLQKTGRPGIGKTSFSTKLLRLWASGEAFNGDEHFNVVFLLKFRRFNNDNANLSLRDLMARSETVQSLDDAVWDFIKQEPTKVLLIFDGLDEYSRKEDIKAQDDPTYKNCVEEKMPLSVLYNKLAEEKLLPGASILTTTRPTAVKCVCHLPFQRTVEIRGFTSDDVREYVENFTRGKVSLRRNSQGSSQPTWMSLLTSCLKNFKTSSTVLEKSLLTRLKKEDSSLNQTKSVG
ncbi:PREDICTED: uncharacterized protein LOC107328356 [Acropora digitifera]|uniref:uncharacterized protein LOC107328356 n=1 Tax=Acropora digitifera TaxID=70779 RepID=UPI00077A0C91|nr:PREDICTED: uncharacterized protein LOC107328356 [Acropora digitifera]